MSETERRLNKLCKWRAIFAGWQLGTRTSDDPECQAVRDHREVTMLLRAEVSALAGLLIEKGVFTQEEYEIQVGDEAAALDEAYARRFPGFQSTDLGMAIVDVERATETMRGWKP